MLNTTYDAIKAVLKADASISAVERNQLLTAIRNGAREKWCAAAHNEPRLLRRKQAAEKLAVSLRTLDKFCATGFLTKRTLPGRKRASGIPADQVDALIVGKVARP